MHFLSNLLSQGISSTAEYTTHIITVPGYLHVKQIAEKVALDTLVYRPDIFIEQGFPGMDYDFPAPLLPATGTRFYLGGGGRENFRLLWEWGDRKIMWKYYSGSNPI